MKSIKIFISGLFILSVIVLLRCMWSLDNPSDSHSSAFTVESKALIYCNSNGPFFQFDTISFFGGVSSKPVEEAGLVTRYQWDFGNDGAIDTTLFSNANIKIPILHAGTYSVAIRLIDQLGNTSEDVKTIFVLPRFKVDILLPDIDLSMDTSCAFYSQSQYTMKPIVLMGRYFTYRNKSESMSVGNFIFELLKNITGTIDYNSIALPYKKSFSNGIYTLGNNDLTMNAAFLYGSTSNSHKENDTIRYDLFDPESYIRSFKIQLTPPYYSYEQGPLWDLTNGFKVDISNPLKPHISMNIALGDLKFTGRREIQGRYTLSAEMSDSNTVLMPTFEAIFFNYFGVARIAPFFIKDITTLVERDSLEIDLSGSRIVSDSFPMTFPMNHYDDTSKLKYNFFITQQMLNQKVRFGNAGGNRKVTGSYIAQSQLSVQDLSLVRSYFAGKYSTSATDTAMFYCDQGLISQFGSLYFDSPQKGYITFISDRYFYQFTMKDGSVSLGKKAIVRSESL